MLTDIADSLVGQPLKTIIKSAGEEAVGHICSSLGSILNGAHKSSAQASEKIDEVIFNLRQLQNSLQLIEQAVAHVDLDIVAMGVQKEISTINSTYDSYLDALNSVATTSKAADTTAVSEWCKPFVHESTHVKNEILKSIHIIHGFFVIHNYLEKLATATISQAADVFDLYSKVKLPLVKVVMVEIKEIHLLRLAGAATNTSTNIRRGMSRITGQQYGLSRAVGVHANTLVSAILTKYPEPARVSISPYGTWGLVYGDRNGHSMWYGGQNDQLWHIELANGGPIVTDGSKVNGFRFLHVDSKKHISIQPKPLLQKNDLGAVESSTDAEIWGFHLTSERKLIIQSQAYPDTYLTAIDGSRAKDSQSFIVNTYDGITEMHDGEFLTIRNYLEDGHRRFRLTFKDKKLGICDVKDSSWKWDSGVAIERCSKKYLRFSGAGVLTLFQDSKEVRSWVFANPVGNKYILRVTYEGALAMETSDSRYHNWSNEN